MKIRNGFVSNSSSSNFVVLCKEIDSSEIIKAISDGEKVYTLGEGYCLSEGVDFFPLDESMANYLLKNAFGFQCYIVNEMFVEEKTLNSKDISFDKNGNVHIMSMEVSHHHSYSLQDLKERYNYED
jgi:hypothetical protein